MENKNSTCDQERRHENYKLNNSNSDLKDKTSIRLTKKNVLRSLEFEDNIAKNLSEKKCKVSEKNIMMSKQTKAVPGPQLPPKRLPKQIRFDLDTSVTPPPKEFKRLGSQRKTLRAARCMSTIITDKERALLLKKQVIKSEERLNSPKPPTGIVQSMCKFYSDRKVLNRSSSFSTSNGSPSPNSDTSASLSDKNRSPITVNTFGLFRNLSFRKKKESLDSEEIEENEPQRCSPSYSTKSQDSGFADSAAGSQANVNNNNKQLQSIYVSDRSEKQSDTLRKTNGLYVEGGKDLQPSDQTTKATAVKT